MTKATHNEVTDFVQIVRSEFHHPFQHAFHQLGDKARVKREIQHVSFEPAQFRGKIIKRGGITGHQRVVRSLVQLPGLFAQPPEPGLLRRIREWEVQNFLLAFAGQRLTNVFTVIAATPAIAPHSSS